jgi:predicted RNA-binding Zn-ribbon protein involved in translation (DUF1610 family)
MMEQEQRKMPWCPRKGTAKIKTKEKAHCNGCGFEGPPNKFKGCASYHHDLRCPQCGTTDIDTTAINRAWAERGERYGYGDDNFLLDNG